MHTLQQIWEDYNNGVIQPSELPALIRAEWKRAGLTDQQGSNAWNYISGGENAQLDDPAVRTYLGLGGQPTGPSTPPGVTGTMPSTPATRAAAEIATDPLTAYLGRLGIGGKTNYNPAEAYQVGLFDPYKNLFDIQQRLSRPGASYQDPTAQNATFSQFLDKAGGGIGGLTGGAFNQLRSIYGGTQAQKTGVADPLFPSDTSALGYEPSKWGAGTAGEAAGQGPNPGRLSELADLFQYGLRNQAGIQGARYAAGALPRAQQSYYAQKAGGGAGASSFLDWLKQNWGLQF